MPSLPSPLQNRLRAVLLKCAPFGSNDALRAVFSDARIAAWQHNVPEATSSASRVSFLVSQFVDAWNANGENVLSLFLCALSEFPDRGAQCPAAELCALSAEVHRTLVAGKIAECERELAQLKDHQARGWGDPAYAQRRAAELQAQIQTWQQRQESPPLCLPETVEAASPVVNTPPVTGPSAGAAETYTELEIHIAPGGKDSGLYAVTAELDGEGKFYGTLQMGQAERAALLETDDAKVYGLMLFDALFRDDILRAYDKAQERAHYQHNDRMRLRLWIDHEAADLHALVWERLHYRSEGGAFPVTMDAKLPFSRYFGLQRGEASAITGMVRMLCVISNPQDLADKGFAPLDVQVEVANLQSALDGLRKIGVSITLMPGQTGLSADQARTLAEAGYGIVTGPTSLNRIVEQLAYGPGYHIVHFLGHGSFSERRDQAVLVLEDNSGHAQRVKDEVLTSRLAGLDHKPHLIFLAACQSATRTTVDATNPFVGLSPRLVQIGIPAVVAMQDKIGVKTAQELTRHFYRFLLEHGIVDKALNQARNLLEDTQDWATPVLFMRLREGQLLKLTALPPQANPAPPPNNSGTRQASVETPKPAALPPNPFTDMLIIRDTTRFVGREGELQRLLALLRSGSVTLVGEPKIGKSSLMARLADRWKAENGGHVFGPLDCQGLLDCADFFAELARLLGLPAIDDRRKLRDALRTTTGLLLIDELDCAPGWGLTADDFALFRAACSANPHFKLVVVSREPLKAIFPDSRRGSPAYNFLIPYTLGEMSTADARALLAHPWDAVAPAFDAATVETLLALAGAHPFKLQRAAHHRYEVFAHPGYDWQTAYRDEIAQML
ncbi:MAG: CHAT domain-containing protein [Anaerolineae bacterium]